MVLIYSSLIESGNLKNSLSYLVILKNLYKVNVFDVLIPSGFVVTSIFAYIKSLLLSSLCLPESKVASFLIKPPIIFFLVIFY